MRKALLLLLAAVPSFVQAQNPAPADSIARRVAQATRRSGDITIDGRLDDAAWAAAVPTSDFTQSYPNPGAPATSHISAGSELC